MSLQGSPSSTPRSYWRSVARRVQTPWILGHLDVPDPPSVTTNLRYVEFRGWCVTKGGRPAEVHVVEAGKRLASFPCDEARGDVYHVHGKRFRMNDPFCGFRFLFDLTLINRTPRTSLSIEFTSGTSKDFAGPVEIVLSTDVPYGRGEYKSVWNSGTDDVDHARLVIAGPTTEEHFLATGKATKDILIETVGIGAEDIVMEIGCGIGRVGEALAPICKEWIGSDVSENMLDHVQRRLARFPNVRTVPLNGYDLRHVPDQSLDVIYSTVVFPHLDDWERYRYIREGLRALKPGGRMLVDNYNLLAPIGWDVFMTNENCYHPRVRPPSVGRGSTPQELEVYFQRAGFEDIRQRSDELTIYTWGRKPIEPNV